MTLRDQRQQEFAQAYIQSNGSGILYLCPRFGKCRVAIQVFQSMKNPKILIAYPDNKIKESWINEFTLMDYTGNIEFTTHLSLHKYKEYDWDLIVIDEIHLLSEAQLSVAQEMNHCRILGLTGTMTHWTEKLLKDELDLKVLARYPIEQAIKEKVVTDYCIYVTTVPLDNKVVQTFGQKKRTELAHFKAYTFIINKLADEGKDTFHLRLARMRIIQNSLAKIKATKKILQEYPNDRILVFCGLTKVADKLGCPVYHSKKGEKEMFEKFAQGEGNHLAVVKIGNTGVTYKPLNKVLISYFDSNAENLAQKINRCMAMEYDNASKMAEIYIISTDELVEKKWLIKALEFFDKNKVKYI